MKRGQVNIYRSGKPLTVAQKQKMVSKIALLLEEEGVTVTLKPRRPREKQRAVFVI
jgi:hypothetical protein